MTGMVKFRRWAGRPKLACSFFTVCLAFSGALRSYTQLAEREPQQPDPYRLEVPVDEINVLFHAEGERGESVPGLTLKDLAILDNGQPPREILSFESVDHLHVHAGIVIDTSRSAREFLVSSRRSASLFAALVLEAQTDQAFVMRFDSESKVLQNWTGDGQALTSTINQAAADSDSRMGGTVLYDSLYKACRDQFTGAEPENVANLLLLFSDGLDNASHAWLQDDVEMCQRHRVAIYAVSPEPKAIGNDGQKILKELSFKTGGGLLFDQQDGHLVPALRAVIGGERDVYRIVYKPAGLKRDGKFHTVRLKSMRHGIVLRARTGYYAPTR